MAQEYEYNLRRNEREEGVQCNGWFGVSDNGNAMTGTEEKWRE